MIGRVVRRISSVGIDMVAQAGGMWWLMRIEQGEDVAE